MSRRTKVLIIILIVAILILLYWLFLRPKPLAPPVEEPAPQVNVNEAPPPPVALPPAIIEPAAPPPEVTPEEKSRADLGRLAASFAERFGSYSNQGEFENILDLKPLMTNKMQSWADDFIAKSQAERGDISVYFGVTTRSISTNIAKLDEAGGRAVVTVGTQRREASGTMADNMRIYYQDLELKFIKVEDEWKVDEAVWK